MAPVFTIGNDMVVTGFPSDPHETPTDDVTTDFPTMPLRLSVDTTPCVLENEVYPNRSRLVLTIMVDGRGWGLSILIPSNSE